MGLLYDYHVMLTLGFVKVTRVVMWKGGGGKVNGKNLVCNAI